jgi:hypothetical protein
MPGVQNHLPSLDTAQDRADAVFSRCSGCDASVTIHRGVAVTTDGSAFDVTYADTDIVVWDCRGCGATNADVFETS